MGHKAELEDVESTETKVDLEVVTEDETENSEDITDTPKGKDTEGESTDEEELEIVREGTQTSTDNQSGIRKRINKLNAKVDKAKQAAGQTNADLELERERNKLLQIALEQEKNKPVSASAPNPDDFDLGRDDPQFIKKDREFLTADILQKVQGTLAESNQQQQNTVTTNTESESLIRKQTQHYEKVKDLKVKGYLDREDKAIEILGTDVVNYLINKVPDAHNLLYYLGTDGVSNRADAEKLAHLAKTDAEGALLELGRLQAEIKVKPKSKNKQAPDPDEEIQGGLSSQTKKRKGPTFT